jgi:hypothetical protein
VKRWRVVALVAIPLIALLIVLAAQSAVPALDMHGFKVLSRSTFVSDDALTVEVYDLDDLAAEVTKTLDRRLSTASGWSAGRDKTGGGFYERGTLTEERLKQVFVIDQTRGPAGNPGKTMVILHRSPTLFERAQHFLSTRILGQDNGVTK